MSTPTFPTRVFWTITGLGVSLPWLVGVVLNLLLRAKGNHDLPWALFIEPASILVLMPTYLWFASPYVGLAILAWLFLKAPVLPRFGLAERFLIILGGLLWGTVGAVRTLIELYMTLDPLVLLLLLPALYASDMVVGLLGGAAAAGALAFLQRPWSSPHH
ncbi:MAG: hypothetical protein KDH15_14680 [Rhodocyclaceae bacterium]|nr:hypothetical protein [Rhodocyclaceae bacterium]